MMFKIAISLFVTFVVLTIILWKLTDYYNRGSDLYSAKSNVRNLLKIKISLKHSQDSAELEQYMCYFFFYETA